MQDALATNPNVCATPMEHPLVLAGGTVTQPDPAGVCVTQLLALNGSPWRRPSERRACPWCSREKP
jgi:hypothetical protein